ncbi:MAG: glycosyltransferase [Anaerolineae bacterium]|nr:glycosyltransferase [Anaerolineae bacterium]
MRILIAGNPLPFHVGAHFYHAAEVLGVDVVIQDTQLAFSHHRLMQSAYWRFLGKRPLHMGRYSRAILEQSQTFKPELLLSIGAAPVNGSHLNQIGKQGVCRAVFLTDDPFNPVHDAAWFKQALRQYDYIFTPRRSNLSQLKSITNATISYLPFAYNPSVHYPASIPVDERQMGSDILFAGGADSDRLPWINAFIKANMSVKLYGGYWEKYDNTRPYAHGHADLELLRHLVPTSKINLGLVRRANRDGHVMRSFEVPAMGGMFLAEDTEEHRDLFGTEGETVLYFSDYEEAVVQAKWLLARLDERQRLATAVYQHITNGKHTYADRLQTILDTIRSS